MNNNKFIDFDMNNSKVKITLEYDLQKSEEATPFVPPLPEFGILQYKELILEALSQKLHRFISDVIEIAQQNDAVFTELSVYSNTLGKMTSFHNITVIEEAIDVVNKTDWNALDAYKLKRNFVSRFRPYLLTIYCSICTMDRKNIDEKLYNDIVNFLF